MITVVIAGDKNFSAYITKARDTTEALGYPTLIYDLGDLGFGQKFEGKVSNVPLHTIPCKPWLLLDSLDHVPADSYVVWLDGDALLQQRIDEIEQDYDIGVTMRTKAAQDPRVSLINAGIVFVKNTPQAREFLTHWGNEATQLDGDQWALNKLCELTMEDRDHTVTRLSAKIKNFPCQVYNNFYFKNDQSQAKILHYKSKFRNKYPL
jgi:hypothetical protein